MGFKLPKETRPPLLKFPFQRWNVSPVGKVTFHKMSSSTRQFPSLLEISWQNFTLWPMPGQCYVSVPVAKRLINASLFQSSLRRKWSGSTSTNPDKAISLLCIPGSPGGVGRRRRLLSVPSSPRAVFLSSPLFHRLLAPRRIDALPLFSSLLPSFYN